MQNLLQEDPTIEKRRNELEDRMARLLKIKEKLDGFSWVEVPDPESPIIQQNVLPEAVIDVGYSLTPQSVSGRQTPDSETSLYAMAEPQVSPSSSDSVHLPIAPFAMPRSSISGGKSIFSFV